MEAQSPAIEMYQKDIEELEKLINIALRPNIKRQLQEYKNNLSNLMAEEKKKIESEKKKTEEAQLDKKKSKKELKKEIVETQKAYKNLYTSENIDKSPSEIDQAKLNAQFTTISKYAFDTSNNKFIKLYLTDGFEGIKEFSSSNIKSNFTKTSFDVCILNWKQRNYRFSCFNLSKEINPSDSYVKQTNSGLIVYLAKAGESSSLLPNKPFFFSKESQKSEVLALAK